VILVDDASESPTRDVAEQISKCISNVKLVRFARNSGQHAALLAGVREARYPIVVTIDDDLQNPPEEIPKLLERLAVGDVDVVYGYTPQTSHSWFRRIASAGVRRAVARATRLDSIQYAGPFRAFPTELREGFAGAVGPGVSLDVLLSWSTQRFGHVTVRHDVRAEGESGYTMRKLVRFAFDTLTGYSTSLLNVVTALGLAAVALGLGILTWVLGRYFFVGASVAGFPFLASSIALFSGAQMLSLGIIGQYLGRIHVRVQGRPSYHIAERVCADQDLRAQELVE
jgi:undecaprenyl-phosphate 4-deoxy-4-formamido-L-arabinose transferase